MIMFILNGAIDNYILINGKKYSYFAGNNYLGLANHPALKEAAASAIEKYGLNFSASRQTTGTSDLHLQLEKSLSEFKNKPDAVSFASGYLGNKILLHALQDRYDAVFIDESSHPSIKDAVPNHIRNIHFYKHCQPEHLDALLTENRTEKPLIITDGIFTLTADIAPLDKIYPIAQKNDAILIVDDAHATGIFGRNGRGTPEYFNLDGKENIFQSETMSKAFGAYGGFICGPVNLINTIREKSPVFTGSTALPPPLAAAGAAAINIMGQHPDLRTILLDKASRLREKIIDLEFDTSRDRTPLVPIFIRSREKAQNLSDFLKKNYIIAPLINYPVKNDKFIVRISISVNHTQGQIEQLFTLLKQWRDQYGVD